MGMQLLSLARAVQLVHHRCVGRAAAHCSGARNDVGVAHSTADGDV